MYVTQNNFFNELYTKFIHWAKKETSVFQEAVNISYIRNIPLKLISKFVKKSREPKNIFFKENHSSRTLASVQLSQVLIRSMETKQTD